MSDMEGSQPVDQQPAPMPEGDEGQIAARQTMEEITPDQQMQMNAQEPGQQQVDPNMEE
jgi:hypothetical protein